MIDPFLKEIPEQFRPVLQAHWKEYLSIATDDDVQMLVGQDVLGALCKVWVSSAFVAESCKRSPSLLSDLLNSGDLRSETAAQNYPSFLGRSDPATEDDLYRILREFRRREMVRIAWRDIAGWSELDETVQDVSLLAEVSIRYALDFLYQRACANFGAPNDSDGNPIRMVVLAMGKLGARELNYSSDVDLIFAMPEDGVFDDPKQTSYSQFFIRIARKLIQSLNDTTSEGFVFRVDMRLRPWGDAGPLVMSFDAIEKYYREQGREWERYAMVKARVIAGDIPAAENLQARLTPFVYRSYLDYGVFDELRTMKNQIVEQQRERNRIQNIKLGPGGIRDVEFIGQVFQLIRGGRDPGLRVRELQIVLRRIAGRDLLPQVTVNKLVDAYRFLRKVEHRLQQYEDKQTNDIPSAPDHRDRLAFSMDFADYDSFEDYLNATRSFVGGIFEQVFAAPQLRNQSLHAQEIWELESQNEKELREKLVGLGFSDPSRAAATLEKFRVSPVIGRLQERGAKALHQLMPLIINATADFDMAEEALDRVVEFISRIAQKSMYISLLLEHPLALDELLQLAAHSTWIVDHISKDPVLLDELLNPNKLYEPLIKEELLVELESRVADIDPEDVEAQILGILHFKQVYVLRVAAADVSGAIPIVTVGDYLTDIAEVVLEVTTRLAWRASTAKFGISGQELPSFDGFGVVAHGRLGCRELSYDSPLEIEFIWEVPGEPAVSDKHEFSPRQFHRAVANRLHLLLTSITPNGRVYDLSAPGKPADMEGSLVISEIEDYQQRDLQPLDCALCVEARYLFGDAGLGSGFAEYRAGLLSSGVAIEDVSRALGRKRIEESARLDESSKMFNLEFGRGGIADLIAVIVLGVLTHGEQHPDLLDDVETMARLHSLSESGFLDDEEYRQLQRAYLGYRSKVHELDLQHKPRDVDADVLTDSRRAVDKVYERLFG